MDAPKPLGIGFVGKERSTGFRYFDRAAATGMRLLDMKAGGPGRARIRALARGASLVLPDLPLQQLPISVQLVNSEGECWEATYSTLVRNGEERVLGRSD